ncbi:uncharacterized protein LOC115627248 isoform X1 [Scaptodrosophila lebanonensis]|uniref:Uncharacterized protein LOC115627248 isoform X1 n=1 Tax=Drosophila lebanonensis TaxID=7225 RepID=A0A6J2TUA8_DROLE|nr:uncharacterized protein LOC115627248 isoform X1 [Scaptodrosophila lebanonensis]
MHAGRSIDRRAGGPRRRRAVVHLNDFLRDDAPPNLNDAAANQGSQTAPPMSPAKSQASGAAMQGVPPLLNASPRSVGRVLTPVPPSSPPNVWRTEDEPAAEAYLPDETEFPVMGGVRFKKAKQSHSMKEQPEQTSPAGSGEQSKKRNRRITTPVLGNFLKLPSPTPAPSQKGQQAVQKIQQILQPKEITPKPEPPIPVPEKPVVLDKQQIVEKWEKWVRESSHAMSVEIGKSDADEPAPQKPKPTDSKAARIPAKTDILTVPDNASTMSQKVVNKNQANKSTSTATKSPDKHSEELSASITVPQQKYSSPSPGHRVEPIEQSKPQLKEGICDREPLKCNQFQGTSGTNDRMPKSGTFVQDMANEAKSSTPAPQSSPQRDADNQPSTSAAAREKLRVSQQQLSWTSRRNQRKSLSPRPPVQHAYNKDQPHVKKDRPFNVYSQGVPTNVGAVPRQVSASVPEPITGGRTYAELMRERQKRSPKNFPSHTSGRMRESGGMSTIRPTAIMYQMPSNPRLTINPMMRQQVTMPPIMLQPREQNRRQPLNQGSGDRPQSAQSIHYRETLPYEQQLQGEGDVVDVNSQLYQTRRKKKWRRHSYEGNDLMWQRSPPQYCQGRPQARLRLNSTSGDPENRTDASFVHEVYAPLQTANTGSMMMSFDNHTMAETAQEQHNTTQWDGLDQSQEQADADEGPVSSIEALAMNSTLNQNATPFRPMFRRAIDFRLARTNIGQGTVPATAPGLGRISLISARRRRQRIRRKLRPDDLNEMPSMFGEQLDFQAPSQQQQFQYQPPVQAQQQISKRKAKMLRRQQNLALQQHQGLLPTPDMPPSYGYEAALQAAPVVHCTDAVAPTYYQAYDPNSYQWAAATAPPIIATPIYIDASQLTQVAPITFATPIQLQEGQVTAAAAATENNVVGQSVFCLPSLNSGPISPISTISAPCDLTGLIHPTTSPPSPQISDLLPESSSSPSTASNQMDSSKWTQNTLDMWTPVDRMSPSAPTHQSLLDMDLSQVSSYLDTDPMLFSYSQRMEEDGEAQVSAVSDTVDAYTVLGPNNATTPPIIEQNIRPRHELFVTNAQKKLPAGNFDLNLVPPSIKRLYRLICTNYSDYSFLYALSAQICQDCVPMECFVYVKMALLASLNSFEPGELRAPISLWVIANDSHLANNLLHNVGQLAPRFIGPHEGGQQQQPSALPSRYTWHTACPLVMAQQGVYYIGDWNRLQREQCEELEKCIENGAVPQPTLQAEQPLEASIWMYWQPDVSTKQTEALAKFCPLFGLPIYMDVEEGDSLWDLMLRQHSCDAYELPLDEFHIPSEDMRSLFVLLHQRKVVFTTEAERLLQKYYVISRVQHPTIFSSKTFVVLKQFAESFAKLSLRLQVLETDVIVSIFLCENFVQRVFGPSDNAPSFAAAFNVISKIDPYMNEFTRWLLAYLDCNGNDEDDDGKLPAKRARVFTLDLI